MRLIPILFILLALLGCTKAEPADSLFRFVDSEGRTVAFNSLENVAVLSASSADILHLSGVDIKAVTSDAFEDNYDFFDSDTVNLGSLKNPNGEILLSIEPSLVVLSPTLSGHIAIAGLLDSANIPYAFIEADSFESYLNVLKTFTDFTGRHELYEENGLRVKEEIDSLIKDSQSKNKSKVLLIRAYSSSFKVKGNDTVAGKIISDLGALSLADLYPSLLEEFSIEKIVEENPEHIFITIMGSDEEKAISRLNESLFSNPALIDVDAVKNDNVHYLEKELFHLKPNDRWDESYETVYKILYSD